MGEPTAGDWWWVKWGDETAAEYDGHDWHVGDYQLAPHQVTPICRIPTPAEIASLGGAPDADDGVRSVDELRAEVERLAAEVWPAVSWLESGGSVEAGDSYAPSSDTVRVRSWDKPTALRMLRGALLARLGRDTQKR